MGTLRSLCWWSHPWFFSSYSVLFMLPFSNEMNWNEIFYILYLKIYIQVWFQCQKYKIKRHHGLVQPWWLMCILFWPWCWGIASDHGNIIKSFLSHILSFNLVPVPKWVSLYYLIIYHHNRLFTPSQILVMPIIETEWRSRRHLLLVYVLRTSWLRTGPGRHPTWPKINK